MRQAINNVNVEGILNEVDLNVKVDSSNREYVSGKVILLVDQMCCGKPDRNEVAVNVFAYKLTKAGKNNPAFESACQLLQNGVSVAACGDEASADRYRVTGCNLSTNEFTAQDGRHVVYPTIRASFFNKVTKDFNPTATFEQEIVIGSINDEIVNDDPTGRLLVQGIIVGYNDRVDSITYVVEDENAVNHIRNYWSADSTVKVWGKVRSTVSTVTRSSSEEVGFGEAPTRTYQKTTREFVITSGSPQAYDDDLAFNINEVRAALIAKKNAASVAPAAPAKSPAMNRGF